MEKTRKPIDLEVSAFRKLQMQALLAGITVKEYIEKLVEAHAKTKFSPEKFVSEMNK